MVSIVVVGEDVIKSGFSQSKSGFWTVTTTITRETPLSVYAIVRVWKRRVQDFELYAVATRIGRCFCSLCRFQPIKRDRTNDK